MEHFHNVVGEENWFDYMELYDSMVNHFPDG